MNWWRNWRYYRLRRHYETLDNNLSVVWSNMLRVDQEKWDRKVQRARLRAERARSKARPLDESGGRA